MTDHEIATVLDRMRQLWPKLGLNEIQEQAFSQSIKRLDIDIFQAVACIDNIFATQGKGWPEVGMILTSLNSLVARPKYNHVRTLRNLTVDVYRARQEKKGHGGKTDEQVIVFQCRHSDWTLEQQFEHCVQCLMELPTYRECPESALRRAMDAYPGQSRQAQAMLDRYTKPSHFRRKEKGVEA